MKILFDDVCEILEKNGEILVGNNEGQPPLIGVSFSKHDRDILEIAGLSKEQIDAFFKKENKIHELEKQSDKGESEIPIAPIKIADWLIERHIEQVEKCLPARLIWTICVNYRLTACGR